MRWYLIVSFCSALQFSIKWGFIFWWTQLRDYKFAWANWNFVVISDALYISHCCSRFFFLKKSNLWYFEYHIVFDQKNCLSSSILLSYKPFLYWGLSHRKEMKRQILNDNQFFFFKFLFCFVFGKWRLYRNIISVHAYFEKQWFLFLVEGPHYAFEVKVCHLSP